MNIQPFDPNPYADFDPSQWSNPYSNFQSQAIPFPASYSGWPTNALGQPIQAPPGMTLNSSAASPAAPAAAAPAASQNDYVANPQSGMMMPNPGAFQGNFAGGVDPTTGLTRMQANAAVNRYYNPTQMSMVGGQQSGIYGMGGGQTVGGTMMGPSPASMAAPWAGQQAAAPAAAAPAANPSGLTSQQYLQMMANPGRVTTPGATAPQAQTPYQPSSGSAASPGVLQQFLANWNLKQSGPGSGFTQQFAQALGKGS
jgi:hypothetical protein